MKKYDSSRSGNGRVPSRVKRDVSMRCMTGSTEVTFCEKAWKRVRGNGGGAEIDKETIQRIEQREAEEFLEEIQGALRAGRYRPSPVKRRYLPKADGKQRPLGDTDGAGPGVYRWRRRS